MKKFQSLVQGAKNYGDLKCRQLAWWVSHRSLWLSHKCFRISVGIPKDLNGIAIATNLHRKLCVQAGPLHVLDGGKRTEMSLSDSLIANEMCKRLRAKSIPDPRLDMNQPMALTLANANPKVFEKFTHLP